jgi:hypothetical protein
MPNNEAEQYINLYKKLHEDDPFYGTSSTRWLPIVQHYVSDLNPQSILDYGCGKSNLVLRIKTEKDTLLYRYDPAIPEYANIPVDKVGMVINIDVMEHIPESALDATLEKISSLSSNVFFNISCVSAWNKLPDGSNAHCTVHPPEWWEQKLKKYFKHVEKVKWINSEIALFVTWKAKSHYTIRYGTLRKIRRGLINLLCIFIPVRRWRRSIRERFFYF